MDDPLEQFIGVFSSHGANWADHHDVYLGKAALALTTWVEAALLDNDAKKFAAVFLLLKDPGTRPYVEPGVGRLTPLDKIDDYRNNWWYALKDKEAEGERQQGTLVPSIQAFQLLHKQYPKSPWAQQTKYWY